MSVKIMSWIWEHSETKGSTRLVLLALADSANDDGVCWPAIDTVAHKCRLSRRYVIDILQGLERDGAISKTHRFDENREYTSNLYKVVAGSEARITTPSEPRLTTGSEARSTGVVRPASLKPSINRNIEPSLDEEEKRPAIFAVYESEIGPLTPMIAQSLEDLEKEHTFQWTQAAIREASKNNARNLAYITAILNRWKVEGYGSEKKRQQYRNQPQPTNQPALEPIKVPAGWKP